MRFGGDPALMQVTASGTAIHRRSEISFEELAQVRPALIVAIVDGARVELPGLEGWSFIAKQPASSVLLVAMAASDDRKKIAFTAGAANDAFAAAAWESRSENPPPSPPWLQIHEIERPADGTRLADLADLARCIAWAWFEPTWHPETWVPDHPSANEAVRIEQGMRIAGLFRFALFGEPERQAMRAYIERNLDTIAEEPSEDEIKQLVAKLKEMSEEEQAAWLRRQALQIAVMDEMTEEARDLIAHHGHGESELTARLSIRNDPRIGRATNQDTWGAIYIMAMLVMSIAAITATSCFG